MTGPPVEVSLRDDLIRTFCQNEPYSKFYDPLRYILLFMLGGAVNTAEEEEHLVNQVMIYGGVFRAALGFAWV